MVIILKGLISWFQKKNLYLSCGGVDPALRELLRTTQFLCRKYGCYTNPRGFGWSDLSHKIIRTYLAAPTITG